MARRFNNHSKTVRSEWHSSVTVDTVKSQLLYEIQGIYYLNSDVIGDLSNVQCDQVAPNRIRVFGTKGLPAPETLKVAILSLGGYQAELSVYPAGLDIPKKVENFRIQTGRILDKNRFQSLEIQVYEPAGLNFTD
ncbi:Protein of unknown function DUF1446 [Lasallia pustulata]|uniref:Acyclic terpene utilisation N-terminal domain-containing protein n=1 Tax=Lasallia pustulata TaxID=136370 RepID=A0A1W5D1U8_9LECA|nr:Protein of unknown function DUF1446 [Lasallia pustulata]